MEDKWWQWPANKHNNFLPWYSILRRVIFAPFIIIGLIFIFVGICFGQSWNRAVKILEEII